MASAALARSAARWERISEEADPATALARIVEAYLDPAHIAAAERGVCWPRWASEMARRHEARPAIAASICRMLDVLARCLPGRRRRRALA
jgi:hypothetical protein